MSSGATNNRRGATRGGVAAAIALLSVFTAVAVWGAISLAREDGALHKVFAGTSLAKAFSGQVPRGQVTTTLNTLRILQQALEEYASQPSRGGAFPTSLSALVPNYVEPQTLRDGWNREFVYYPNKVAPGDQKTRPYTLYSCGKSGQRNAPDNIDAWNPLGQPAN